MMTLFLLLCVGHAICDFPLQGDFLSRAKNHTAPLPGIPPIWALAWHAAIHGGMVAWVTGDVGIGLLEFAVHMVIDWAKCDGLTSFNVDQWLHIACKVAWVAVVGILR